MVGTIRPRKMIIPWRRAISTWRDNLNLCRPEGPKPVSGTNKKQSSSSTNPILFENSSNCSTYCIWSNSIHMATTTSSWGCYELTNRLSFCLLCPLVPKCSKLEKKWKRLSVVNFTMPNKVSMAYLSMMRHLMVSRPSNTYLGLRGKVINVSHPFKAEFDKLVMNDFNFELSKRLQMEFWTYSRYQPECPGMSGFTRGNKQMKSLNEFTIIISMWLKNRKDNLIARYWPFSVQKLQKMRRSTLLVLVRFIRFLAFYCLQNLLNEEPFKRSSHQRSWRNHLL